MDRSPTLEEKKNETVFIYGESGPNCHEEERIFHSKCFLRKLYSDILSYSKLNEGKVVLPPHYIHKNNIQREEQSEMEAE